MGTALGTYFALRERAPEPGEAEALVAGGRWPTPSPLALAETTANSKELSTKTFYSASMAILFLFLTVQFGVLGLLEERQNGTMGRLLAAPISRRSIVVGKALTSFVLGVVEHGGAGGGHHPPARRLVGQLAGEWRSWSWPG